MMALSSGLGVLIRSGGRRHAHRQPPGTTGAPGANEGRPGRLNGRQMDQWVLNGARQHLLF